MKWGGVGCIIGGLWKVGEKKDAYTAFATTATGGEAWPGYLGAALAREV